jgi:LytR cell envelope-related transcriptional attenuator
VQPDAKAGRAVLSSALSVLAVVGLVVALLAVFGHAASTDDAGAAGPVATPTLGRADAAPVPPARPAAPKAPANTGKPAEPADPQTSAAVPNIGVVVMNQSERRGLAAKVASDLEAAGWRVADTGNWLGAVPETTVYYPSGLAAVAKKLAAALDGVDRIRLRQANMAQDKLTVILHSSYPG